MISQADIERARTALVASRDPACARVAAVLDNLRLSPPADDHPHDTLLAACRLLGIRPTYDGCVTEAQAARLLNRNVKTLRNRRHAIGDVPYRKGPGSHGRVEYRLADLQAFTGLRESS